MIIQETQILIYYNAKHNFFRTPELWDLEILMELHFPTEKDFIKYMDKIKSALKHGAYFVLDVSHEPRKIPAIFLKEQYDWNPTFLDWILNYIKKNKLNKSAIQIWTGDLNIDKNVDKKYRSIIKPKIRFNHLSNFSIDRNYLNEREFDKKFTIMLCRLKQKPERVITYDFLNDMDILKDTYYCFNTMNPIDKQYPTIFLETDEEKSKDYFDKARYGEKYFRKSFLHIVVESWFSNEHALGRKFISEKIFRATNSCQPFVIIGTHNFLKEFKELGFKSFDKWWDESYDEIENNEERLSAVFKIIENLNKLSLKELKEMYLEMLPIIEHNFDNAFKINSNSKYELPIDGVFNEIGGLEYVYEEMCLPNMSGYTGLKHETYSIRKNKI